MQTPATTGPTARPASDAGPTAVVHYTIYLPNGLALSSYETGYPFRFDPNDAGIIPGLAHATASMEVGETRRIALAPHQAFGEHDPRKVYFAPYNAVSSTQELAVGQAVRLSLPQGLSQAFVRDRLPDGFLFDLNHPLAGTDVTMDVTLLAYE